VGPITLFDKSFLQSLSVDESVWFDHFFLSNVCPLFYVETLADLEKAVRKGRTPEQEVGTIADKFPEMNSSPNAHHASLCLGDLMGHSVPMTGQIPLMCGRPVRVGGRTGVVYQESPEAAAFRRWQRREFLEIERVYAKAWRKALATLDLAEIARASKAIGISGDSCTTLQQAKAVADGVVNARDNPRERIELALLFLNVPQECHGEIVERWRTAGYPSLATYAPYAAYVLTIEIFFQVALAAHLIASERPSNRVDIAYLFYLPFCMMFVSSDRLHQRSAPLFLRSNQQFVWGGDLKEGLKKLDEHYAKLPEATRAQGVISFASHPPKEGKFLVATLWDRHLPTWRQSEKEVAPRDPATERELVEEFSELTRAPSLQGEELDFEPGNADTLAIEHLVRKKRGSWWQLPRDSEMTEGK